MILSPWRYTAHFASDPQSKLSEAKLFTWCNPVFSGLWQTHNMEIKRRGCLWSKVPSCPSPRFPPSPELRGAASKHFCDHPSPTAPKDVGQDRSLIVPPPTPASSPFLLQGGSPGLSLIDILEYWMSLGLLLQETQPTTKTTFPFLSNQLGKRNVKAIL